MAVRPPVSYPGVYIQEVPSGVRTIVGVSTSIAVFVGMTRGGRLNRPTRVLNYTEYVRAFGEDTRIGEMTDQVRLFFLNGGQQAIVMRIVREGTGSAAQVTLNDASGGHPVLTLTAKEWGMVGNQIRAEVDYDTPSPESTFNLRLYREMITPSGEIARESQEYFTHLDMEPNHIRYVERIVNQQSDLVDVSVSEDINTDVNRFAGYSLSGLMLDATADIGDIVAGINGLLSTGRNIQIRVDTSPFVNVALQDLSVAGGAVDFSAWQDAINGALASFDVSLSEIELISGPADSQYIRFTSGNGEGGRVTISPAPANDAAAALQLGIGQGGMEVSGYAAQRPAPSGYSASLGSLEDAELTALNAFAGALKSDFGEWTLTDASGETHEGTTPFDSAGPGERMCVGDAFTPDGVFVGSLLNVRENMRFLAREIENHSSGQWRTAVPGIRMILTPLFGGVNSDTTARLNSTGGYAVGADDQLFATANTPNVRTYSLGTGDAGAYQSAVAGSPGSVPQSRDYSAAFDIIDREVDLFNLMVLPRAADQMPAQREAVWGPASSFCRRRRAFLLMDPRDTWNDVNTVADEVEEVRRGVVGDHAALYWPKLRVAVNGGTRDVDPAGAMAGVMARTDAVRGVWKAPAGIEAGLRGIRGVSHMISDGENGRINPQAVNAVRVFPNGIVSWGARTMDGFDNSGNDDYKYIPIRRLALYIEESLYRGLKWVVFEPNDEPLWAQIRLNVGAFMRDLFRQGAFQGQTAGDAYFVKCDAETTPQNDRNLGVVNIWVGFAPLKPAEFVILYLQQMAGQIQV